MDHKALHKEKFLEIIQKHESTDDVKLTKMDLKSGAEKGQNYCGLVVSCHLEAEVKDQPKTYNWMAKVPLDDPTKFDWLRGCLIEKKEVMTYEELIPALKDFIASKGSSIHLDFCPLIYVDYKEDATKEDCAFGSMIIMEHLGHMGYTEPLDKKSGLDFVHLKLVMKSLANFHAATHAFFKSKYESLDDLIEKEPILARDYFMANPKESMLEQIEQFNDGLVEGFLAVLAHSNPNGEKFVESYKRFSKEKMDPIKLRDQLTTPSTCKFNVLCHGDPWFNNMLFKYNNGTPTDICWVDLAMTKWASPTIDLSYVLYLSATPELRQAHETELLEYYHQALTQALKELGEDPSVFTISDLKSDYKKCSFFGFMMSLWFLPWMLAKKEDAMGADEFTGDFTDPKVVEEFNQMNRDRTKIMMENEPRIGKYIAQGFLDMVDNGYFTL